MRGAKICAGVLLFLVSIGAAFYAGRATNPLSLGLGALAQLAYDNKAQEVFEGKLEVIDSDLAEKEFSLQETTRKNAQLTRTLNATRTNYNNSRVTYEAQLGQAEISVEEGISA